MKTAMTIETNQVHLMDCDKGMAILEDESVDLIFTDPPYIKEVWGNAYTVLASHSIRVLKPSGFLISYCGQINLNRIMRIMDDAGLVYYWIITQRNSGAKTLVHARNIIAGFKPVIVYQKPPIKALNRVSLDVISGTRSKAYHAWQQDIHEAIHLIRTFAKPGDLVLDPFTGSGTTLLAAKLLGMNFIGFEIEEDTIEIARMRLSQEPLDLASFGEVVV